MPLLVSLAHTNADSLCWKHARHSLKVANHSPTVHWFLSYVVGTELVRDTLKVVRSKSEAQI
jgi:hypothetical protein